LEVQLAFQKLAEQEKSFEANLENPDIHPSQYAGIFY